MKILVVEDERAISTLLGTVLESAGYAVRFAADVVDAIETCQKESFDLVLSDVRMPRGDGHELARWLAENCPAVRVVLMSGYDLECSKCPYAEQCVMVNKPFSIQQILSAVRTALGRP